MNQFNIQNIENFRHTTISLKSSSYFTLTPKNLISRNGKATCLIIALWLYSINTFAQTIEHDIFLDSVKFVSEHPAITKTHSGSSKSYEKAFRLALSYFPELENTAIKLKYKKIRTTLNTRPTMTSMLFKHRSKRTYVIRINNTSNPGKIKLGQIPLLAAVGLYGHELAHIKDYRSSNFLGIIKRGFQYIFMKSKLKFEHKIDRITIDQGLAYPLAVWAHFAIHESEASARYIRYKKKIYYSDIEIIFFCANNTRG